MIKLSVKYNFFQVAKLQQTFTDVLLILPIISDNTWIINDQIFYLVQVLTGQELNKSLFLGLVKVHFTLPCRRIPLCINNAFEFNCQLGRFGFEFVQLQQHIFNILARNEKFFLGVFYFCLALFFLFLFFLCLQACFGFIFLLRQWIGLSKRVFLFVSHRYS